MTEKLDGIQCYQKSKPKGSITYKLTVWFSCLTVISVVVSCCLTVISIGVSFIDSFIAIAYLCSWLQITASFCFLLGFIFFVLTTLTSLLSMIVNFRRFEKLRVSLLIFIICCGICSITVFAVMMKNKGEAYHSRRARLIEVGMVILSQAGDSENFKMTDQWCDDLLSEIGEEGFMFSNEKGVRSNYALNKNVVGKNPNDFSDDTILLFESINGWNLVGGPELVSCNNHSKYAGKGFHVFYCNGWVAFVEAEAIKQNHQVWEAIEKK